MKKRKGFFDDTEERDGIKSVPPTETRDTPPGDTNAVHAENDDTLSPKNAEESADPDNISDTESLESAAFEEDGTKISNTEPAAKKSKKRNVFIFSSLAVILFSFIAVTVIYSMGFFGDKYEKPGEKDETPKEEFWFFEPDYETDIFTLEGYLALDRSIIYSPDSSQSYYLKDGDYASEGEDGLVVLGEYLNAAIAGDSERINSMFTEEYLKDNEKHGKFPPQKIFKIKIRNRSDLADKNAVLPYTPYYFSVSYRIYRNDGLFRDNVDEEREMAQLFEIFVYEDGTGKINKIVNLPGYVN